MNRTVSVNIGGRVFNIEESAYDKLNQYLNKIRSYFEGNESVDEIISDIELRIAELFMERITEQKQVVTNADVESVMIVMGKPEDYFDAEEESDPGSRRSTINRRVFRDPDNKMLFGVCGGISAYFGWDPIVLRAIFAIFTIFYGVGILIYLLLAIIIPKAKTTAEKLQMRGEPVTVDNISKKVSESFESVRDDIKDFGDKNKDNFRSAGDRVGGFFTDLFDAIGRVLRVLVVVLVKLIGLILLVVGVGGLVGSVAALFGWKSFMAMNQAGMVGDLMWSSAFGGTLNQGIFIWGLSLTILVPVVAFILLGIRLLFDYRRIPGLVGVVLLILWFVGLGLLTAGGMRTFQEFQVETSFTEVVPLEISNSDTLYLDLEGTDGTRYEFSSGFSSQNIFFDDDVTFPGLDSTDIIYMGKVEFTVEENDKDSLYHLVIEREANGSSQKDAVANARQPVTLARMKGDSLLIYPYFAMVKGDKFRNQRVKYILQIPVGKSIHFNQNSEEIIYDVPNITNTYDGDMIGKTWFMTPDGLRCIACPEIEMEEERLLRSELLRNNLEDVDVEIDRLREEMKMVSEQARLELEEQLKELKSVERELEREMEDLRRELK